MFSRSSTNRMLDYFSMVLLISLIWFQVCECAKTTKISSSHADRFICGLKNDISCLALHISIDQYTEPTLTNALTTISKSSNKVRQAFISFVNPLTRSDVSHIGDQIDEFLTPRLEWSADHEPYPWHTVDSLQSNQNAIIVLSRYSPLFEPYLLKLNYIQFPKSKVCDKVPMLIGRSRAIHPGWTSMLCYYGVGHRSVPHAVFTTHVSVDNNATNPDGYTAWIGANECNTTVDKWQCGFLRTTHCVVPDVIAKCNTNQCVRHLPDTFHNTILVSSASAQGKVIAGKSVEAKKVQQFRLPSTADLKLLETAEKRVKVAFEQITPYNSSIKNSRYSARTRETMHVHKFLLRKNYFFRSKIAQQIDTFYMENRINASVRCVAAHMRRGDRIVYGVNMTEFCANASRPITAENPINYCMVENGELENCEGEGCVVLCLYIVCSLNVAKADKGCGSAIPLGAVTLDMILEEAKRIVSPEVKSIFLFTDDEKWFYKEKARIAPLYPEWSIYSMKAPAPPAVPAAPPAVESATKHELDAHKYHYEYMRSRGGSDSGTFFLGSLQLAQQCEGFVAHYASAVPELFFGSMCIQHGVGTGLKQGVCPPVIDLSLKH